jgi:ComF family protein
MLNIFIQSLLTVFFPATCYGCGRGGSYLCSGCKRWVVRQLHQPKCVVCNLNSSREQLVHKDCVEFTHLDGVVGACAFAEPIKTMLHDGKYGGIYRVYLPLGELLAQKLREYPELTSQIDLVTYVPLTSSRQRWRGYNQAKILAEILANSFHKLPTELLLRPENQKRALALQKRQSRQAVIREQFVSATQMSGENVLIVDDVCTTGSTLNECARVLKLNGAGKVYGLTVCHA